LEVGDKVQILPYAGYSNKYTGCIGLVERNPQKSSIGIKLDDYFNKASQYGVFWFQKESLKLINERNSNEMLSGYKVATINFVDGNNSNQNYYYAVYGDSIKPNDYVVVQTGHHGMTVAKIIAIEDTGLDRVACNREVIDRIELKYYNNRKEKAAKIKELKNKMDTKVKELQANAIYEMLAEKDPDLKNMLDEMKQLTEE
jgi:hypothetical protein